MGRNLLTCPKCKGTKFNIEAIASYGNDIAGGLEINLDKDFTVKEHTKKLNGSSIVGVQCRNTKCKFETDNEDVLADMFEGNSEEECLLCGTVAELNEDELCVKCEKALSKATSKREELAIMDRLRNSEDDEDDEEKPKKSPKKPTDRKAPKATRRRQDEDEDEEEQYSYDDNDEDNDEDNDSDEDNDNDEDNDSDDEDYTPPVSKKKKTGGTGRFQKNKKTAPVEEDDDEDDYTPPVSKKKKKTLKGKTGKTTSRVSARDLDDNDDENGWE